MVAGHTVKTWFEPKEDKWKAKCSCGWMTFGKTERQVRATWNKRHINPLDNWK